MTKGADFRRPGHVYKRQVDLEINPKKKWGRNPCRSAQKLTPRPTLSAILDFKTLESCKSFRRRQYQCRVCHHLRQRLKRTSEMARINLADRALAGSKSYAPCGDATTRREVISFHHPTSYLPCGDRINAAILTALYANSTHQYADLRLLSPRKPDGSQSPGDSVHVGQGLESCADRDALSALWYELMMRSNIGCVSWNSGSTHQAAIRV